MSTNPDFVEFVKNTFEKLSDKFTNKNKQYEGEDRIIACGELANFRIGALLKYGEADYGDMYECAKDYVRKHIAYIESHRIDGLTVEDSLEDIAVYAVIMLYMRRCAEQQTKQEK